MTSPSRRAAGDDGPRARLAAQLRALQAATGKSLKELEAVLHVSDSSLSRYLSGRAVPPWPVVENLSKQADADVASVRRLWELADTGRGGTGRTGGSRAEPVAVRGQRFWRRRPVLTAAVVAAVLFGAGGFVVGRITTAPKILTIKPTEDTACADWAWPDSAGQVVQPPVHPQGREHAPTIELVEGKDSAGRQSAWARISGAEFGDRVWLDWSSNDAVSWIQCGPFPVTTSSGTSRAHPIGPGWLFRACGDVPTPAPAPARGQMCTNW